MARHDVSDLGFIRRRNAFRAGDGGRGRGWRKRGKRGEDLTIVVPIGTMVIWGSDPGQETVLADLSADEQEVVVARGGRGGPGNARFATAVNQAPEVAGKGAAGEERRVILEVKPVTDICIIGHPNSGKSTLLSKITRARPDIAAYPFTTREPVVGVLAGDREVFVVAEIPSLVGGAHLGKGLGNAFLRHTERAGVLILLLDGSSPAILEELSQLETEIAEYGCSLEHKARILAVNKLDLPEAQEHVSKVSPQLDELAVPVFYISAASGQGVLELVDRAKDMVEDCRGAEQPFSPPQIAVVRPRPRK